MYLIITNKISCISSSLLSDLLLFLLSWPTSTQATESFGDRVSKDSFFGDGGKERVLFHSWRRGSSAAWGTKSAVLPKLANNSSTEGREHFRLHFVRYHGFWNFLNWVLIVEVGAEEICGWLHHLMVAQGRPSLLVLHSIACKCTTECTLILWRLRFKVWVEWLNRGRELDKIFIGDTYHIFANKTELLRRYALLTGLILSLLGVLEWCSLDWILLRD